MFTYRKATIKDVNLIFTLASQIFFDTYLEIVGKEQVNYMFKMMYAPVNILKQMNELHHIYLIIYNNSLPSGYLSIEKVADNFYRFQKVYSLPEFQGKGIGRFMIEQGRDYLKKLYPAKPFTIELFVNRRNPAFGFYKHMGFKECGTRDAQIGNDFYMNDYIMRMDVEQ
jgi:diamine N-acetyltransferase